MKQKLRRIFFLLAVTGMLLWSQLITAMAAGSGSGQDSFRITVINVGKGDCILVETGSRTVMIDAGYEETASDVLHYLSEHEIGELDVLIISHYDKDHVGGAADIIRNVPVGRVYLPDYTGTSKKYKRMVEALEETSVPFRPVSRETLFRLGEARFTLYPSGIPFDGDNDNDCSLAASVRCGPYSAMFAGDLEKDGIEYFVSKYRIFRSFDILKMPHHGGLEDNTADLLDMIGPKIALITDGHDRRAAGTALDLLAERNAEAFSSVDKGTLVVSGTDDGGYDIQTEKEGGPGIPDQSGLWRYEILEDGSAAVTAYEGDETDLSIPPVLDGHTVSRIDVSAFYDCRDLRRVSIPEGVTEIGASAFSWCTGLKEATLPDSLLSIGEAAFSWCRSLESIVIPERVHTIEDAVFTRSGLKEVTLPAGIEYIGDSSFSHCKKLSSIVFLGSRQQWEEIKKDKSWNKKSASAVEIQYMDQS